MFELQKIYHASRQQPFIKTTVLKEKRIKTLPTLQTLKTTAFVNKSPRFNYQYANNPGPGAYQSNYKQKHSSDFHKAVQYQLNIPKHHQWIISQGRQPFQVKESSLLDCSDTKKKLKRERNHSNWTKDKRFNYEENQQKNIVGPGKYNPQLLQIKQREKSHTLPMRQRATPQTYLQQIMKNRQQRIKIADFEEQVVKYKIQQEMFVKQSPKINTNAPSPVFISKSKRFLSQKQLAAHVGPGAYNLQPKEDNSNKTGKGKALIKAERIKSQLSEQDTSQKLITPGPGSYSFSNLQLDTHHKKTILGIMLKEQRFLSTQKTNVPGPGEYMRKKFIYINKDQAQKNHDTFGTTERFPHIKQASPFGSYDLSYHDISKKLIKQKEYIDKIQQFKYAVIVPPKNQ